jgi:hypothetical protein
MKQFLALVCLSVLSCAAFAQSPRAQAENFMGTLGKGQVAAAYARLFEGSNIGPEQAQAIRRQTESTLAPLGRILGHDLIREEQFGQSLTRLVYLLRSERHATLWELYYYRPGNRWFLAEINYSQKFDALAPKR